MRADRTVATIQTVVFNLTVHYSHLVGVVGGLLENTPYIPLFGQRCGLSLSISLNSPGDSNAY